MKVNPDLKTHQDVECGVKLKTDSLLPKCMFTDRRPSGRSSADSVQSSNLKRHSKGSESLEIRTPSHACETSIRTSNSMITIPSPAKFKSRLVPLSLHCMMTDIACSPDELMSCLLIEQNGLGAGQQIAASMKLKCERTLRAIRELVNATMENRDSAAKADNVVEIRP